MRLAFTSTTSSTTCGAAEKAAAAELEKAAAVDIEKAAAVDIEKAAAVDIEKAAAVEWRAGSSSWLATAGTPLSHILYETRSGRQ